MQQEQVRLNISLDKTTPVVCEECGNDTFTQVLFLRKISKFLTGESHDTQQPIPTFACVKCHYVNKDYQLTTQTEA